MIDGWLCLDKCDGISSNLAMIRARKFFQQKTGYVGTLDPFATGVLPIAIGRTRHFIKYLDEAVKTYCFSVKFGATTDSLDLTGAIIDEINIVPTEQQIVDVLDDFCGTIEQMPPKFSAIKINGRRACDLTRLGKSVELTSRKVTIFSLNMTECNLKRDGTASFEVTCSKGTYVRSLARDIAVRVGSLGYVTKLRRIKCGFFSINQSITLEKLQEMKDTKLLTSVLIPIDIPLVDIPEVSLKSSEVVALLQGKTVQTNLSPCAHVRVYDEDERLFHGVCEICDNGVIRPSSMYINEGE